MTANIIILDKQACSVHKMAEDGNCLFAALAHQIFDLETDSTWLQTMTRTLREMVVTYIGDHANDAAIQFAVQMHIQDEYTSLVNRDTTISTRNFLRLLSQNGCWGGPETLLAIAREFECNILIYRENSVSTMIEGSLNPNNRILRLVYSGPNDAPNHYDSFDRLDVLSSPNAISRVNTIRTHELVTIYEGKCSVVNVHQDGNCMFASFAHQLFQRDIASREHNQLTACLRRLAVQHISEHSLDRTLRNLMDDRIESDFPELLRYDKNESFFLLLQTLSQPSVWGGLECLTALARTFHCTVVTYRELGPTTVIQGDTSVSNRIIRLVMRKINGRWIHYDSFDVFTTDGLHMSTSPAPLSSLQQYFARSTTTTIIDVDDNDRIDPSTNVVNTIPTGNKRGENRRLT